MKTIARTALLVIVGAVALASCTSSSSAPPPPPPPDTKTYWLAPNGSDVVLKLTTAQPTVPF